MEREFFATAAQVVPLLALAGLVEFRMPRDEYSMPAWFDVNVRLVMFTALVIAEVAAFTALAGRPTETERTYVIMGLVVGGMALVVRFAEHAINDVIAAVGNRWIRLVIILVWTIVTIGALLVPAIVVGF